MITPVDYKTAVLLKEKGFDLPCRGRIHCSHFHLVKNNIIPKNVPTYFNDLFAPIRDWNNTNHADPNDKNGTLTGLYLSLPTIAETIMWIYDKHQIWVEVSLIDNSRHFYFDYTIITSKDRDFNDEDCFDSAKRIYDKDKHNSPTEAYMAAINYTLNKLI